MSAKPTPENFDLETAIARRDKLRGRYNRSGLSNTDYNQLLQLEQEIDQHSKADLVSDYTQMTLEQLQREHADLLEFNETLDKKYKHHAARAEKYRRKCESIASLFVVPSENHQMTIKAIQTILEISKENISENLSFSDKEKFENSINIIKNRMKNVSSHFTGRDLNITENILKELVIFKQKSDIKKQEKNLEQDTKELIKNMN